MDKIKKSLEELKNKVSESEQQETFMDKEDDSEALSEWEDLLED